MPKLLGVNLLGVLLAAIAMFLVGFVFYGALFTDIWMSARGLSEDMLQGGSPAWMGAGFVISLVLSFGIGYLMKSRGISEAVPALKFALGLAVLIGFPLLAYDFVYGAFHSMPGLLVDWGHTIVSFGAAAVVLSFFD